MAVLGEYEIRSAARAGERFVYFEPGTIISPSARDAAEFLGIELRKGSPPAPAVVGTDHARAMARTLFRRSPRWVPTVPRRGAEPRRFRRMVIVGAGNVGATTAHQAAISGMADEIVLIDVVPGRAASVALDLEHASGITRSTTHCSGATSMTAVAGADVIVVTAGRPRTPGMSRGALAEVNGRVMADIGAAIAAHAPDAVVVVVTNPVDEMTHALWRASELPDDRVIGIAGTLDSSRFRREIALAANVSVADVDAMTLGSHGDEMVPVVSSATVKGRPVTDVLSQSAIEVCVQRTVEGGAAVVELRRTGSAYLAPAHAVIEVLDAIRGAIAGAVPVSVRAHGEYGIRDVFVGVPARLSMTGVAEIVETRLSPSERAALTAAAAAIATRCGA
jgi:malate dehydrogenase